MADKEDMKENEEKDETAEEESVVEEDEETSDEAASDEAASDEETDTSDEESESEEDAEASDEDEPTSDQQEDASDEDDPSDEDEAEESDVEASRAPEEADDEEPEALGDDDSDAEEAEPLDDDLEDEYVAAEPAEEPTDDEDTGQLRGYAAYYEHPDHLLAAARHARDSRYDDFEAYSPFPIHGMDEAMGMERSWIPWVTFGAGIVGFLTANALQFGMMTFDWPMIIGGKPFAPWPSFVPVMFELTVLVAGVTTAIVMLKAAGCFQKADVIDERITNDRFVLWISAEDSEFDEDEVESFLSDLNPLEIKRVHQ